MKLISLLLIITLVSSICAAPYARTSNRSRSRLRQHRLRRQQQQQQQQEQRKIGEGSELAGIFVACDEDGMEVTLNFSSPFSGIVYPKDHYLDPECRFVVAGSDRQSYNFLIKRGKCGLNEEDNSNSLMYENVIYIQHNQDYMEAWDYGRRLSCKFAKSSRSPRLLAEKKVVFERIIVEAREALRVEMADDGGKRDINLWMNVSKGVYPNNVQLDGAVRVGDNLTLSIYISDPFNRTDIRVKDCYAFDSEKDVNTSANPLLKLSGEDGCPLKAELITPWRRTYDTRNSQATLLTYARVNAFKFPQNNHVHLTCNIELCKGTCPERCPLESSTIDGGSGGESSKPSQEESSVDVSNGKDDDDDEDSDNGSSKGERGGKKKEEDDVSSDKPETSENGSKDDDEDESSKDEKKKEDDDEKDDEASGKEEDSKDDDDEDKKEDDKSKKEEDDSKSEKREENGDDDEDSSSKKSTDKKDEDDEASKDDSKAKKEDSGDDDDEDEKENNKDKEGKNLKDEEDEENGKEKADKEKESKSEDDDDDSGNGEDKSEDDDDDEEAAASNIYDDKIKLKSKRLSSRSDDDEEKPSARRARTLKRENPSIVVVVKSSKNKTKSSSKAKKGSSTRTKLVKRGESLKLSRSSKNDTTNDSNLNNNNNDNSKTKSSKLESKQQISKRSKSHQQNSRPAKSSNKTQSPPSPPPTRPSRASLKANNRTHSTSSPKPSPPPAPKANSRRSTNDRELESNILKTKSENRSLGQTSGSRGRSLKALKFTKADFSTSGATSSQSESTSDKRQASPLKFMARNRKSIRPSDYGDSPKDSIQLKSKSSKSSTTQSPPPTTTMATIRSRSESFVVMRELKRSNRKNNQRNGKRLTSQNDDHLRTDLISDQIKLIASSTESPSRKWDGDALFNPFKELESAFYEPLRIKRGNHRSK